MPAIHASTWDSNLRLEARHNGHGYGHGNEGRTRLTPKAIGLLIPLLFCFVCGPFLCIWFVRNRRGNRIQWYMETKIAAEPVERREDARKRLDGVTEVSNVAGSGKYAYMGTIGEESASADGVSLSERECAICLSTLHAPSPPEPAKLANEVVAPAKAPSVCGSSLSEKEEILRLKVCGHEFHAECLVSWFVIRKYSCPICRAVYFGKEADKGVGDQREMRRVEDSGESEEESNARRREEV